MSTRWTTTESGPPALQVSAVTKIYGTRSNPVHALDGVSLRVMPGELLAVVGPSGSGKSTLLHIMGTLDRPTSGTVMIEETQTTTLDDKALAGLRAARIGFVFQQFHLLAGTTALENVAAGLLYLGVSAAARRESAGEALERVGLGHRLDHVPNSMSGGERQRVAVSRALVARPAFVLADEPTGNLDSHSSGAVMDLIHELHDDGTTIVVITHDTSIATSLPRRVELLDGRVERDTALAVTG